MITFSISHLLIHPHIFASANPSSTSRSAVLHCRNQMLCSRVSLVIPHHRRPTPYPCRVHTDLACVSPTGYPCSHASRVEWSFSDRPYCLSLYREFHQCPTDHLRPRFCNCDVYLYLSRFIERFEEQTTGQCSVPESSLRETSYMSTPFQQGAPGYLQASFTPDHPPCTRTGLRTEKLSPASLSLSSTL